MSAKNPAQRLTWAGLNTSGTSASRQAAESASTMRASNQPVKVTGSDSQKTRAKRVSLRGDEPDDHQPHVFRTLLVRDADLPGLLLLPAARVCGCCGALYNRPGAVVVIQLFQATDPLAIPICRSCTAHPDAEILEVAARVFDTTAEPVCIAEKSRA